jgi:hypothetical protein
MKLFKFGGRKARNTAPGIQCRRYRPGSRLGENQIRLLQTSYYTPLYSCALNDRGAVLCPLYYSKVFLEDVDAVREMGEEEMLLN